MYPGWGGGGLRIIPKKIPISFTASLNIVNIVNRKNGVLAIYRALLPSSLKIFFSEGELKT